MPSSKRKLSVTLDDDLADALSRTGPLSAQINSAVRAEVERRHQQLALADLCDEIVERTGPWTDEDEIEIARVATLLET